MIFSRPSIQVIYALAVRSTPPGDGCRENCQWLKHESWHLQRTPLLDNRPVKRQWRLHDLPDTLRRLPTSLRTPHMPLAMLEKLKRRLERTARPSVIGSANILPSYRPTRDGLTEEVRAGSRQRHPSPHAMLIRESTSWGQTVPLMEARSGECVHPI